MLGFALGIPLLAWGIGDVDGFFSSPARLLYGVSVGLVALCVGIGYLLLRFPYALGRREGERAKRVSRQSIVPVLTRLAWLAGFIISPYGDRRETMVVADAALFRFIGL